MNLSLWFQVKNKKILALLYLYIYVCISMKSNQVTAFIICKISPNLFHIWSDYCSTTHCATLITPLAEGPTLLNSYLKSFPNSPTYSLGSSLGSFSVRLGLLVALPKELPNLRNLSNLLSCRHVAVSISR